MDDNLVGYLLNALDETTHRAVEKYLRTYPEARDKLARLREALEPLESDRDEIEPPPGLVQTTLAELAQVKQFAPRLPVAPRVSGAGESVGGRSWWRRSDVLVAAAALLISLGMGAVWVVQSRQQAQITECKENLHQYHRALVAYSEQRQDRAFPRVEARGPRAVAGIFVPILADAGVLPGNVSVRCPASGREAPDTSPGQVSRLEEWYESDRERYNSAVKELAGGYAYSLGFREGDGLQGLRFGAGNDLLPILADRPGSNEGGPGNSLNHGGGGQNVLTIGGSVRYCTSRGVGLNGDDIYLNQDHRVLAGLSVADTVLGVSDAVP
jgi:hypothetical protein